MKAAAHVQRLEAMQSKQQAVLRRKTEEAEAARKRLKVCSSSPPERISGQADETLNMETMYVSKWQEEGFVGGAMSVHTSHGIKRGEGDLLIS
jgi:hypothetical protein